MAFPPHYDFPDIRRPLGENFFFFLAQVLPFTSPELFSTLMFSPRCGPTDLIELLCPFSPFENRVQSDPIMRLVQDKIFFFPPPRNSFFIPPLSPARPHLRLRYQPPQYFFGFL